MTDVSSSITQNIVAYNPQIHVEFYISDFGDSREKKKKDSAMFSLFLVVFKNSFSFSIGRIPDVTVFMLY